MSFSFAFFRLFCRFFWEVLRFVLFPITYDTQNYRLTMMSYNDLVLTEIDIERVNVELCGGVEEAADTDNT